MAFYEILSLALWAVITVVALVTTGLKSSEAGFYKGLNEGYRRGYEEAKVAFFDTPRAIAAEEREMVRAMNEKANKQITEELLMAYGVGSADSLPPSVRQTHGIGEKTFSSVAENDDEVDDWR